MKISRLIFRYVPALYRLHTARRAKQIDKRICDEQQYYEHYNNGVSNATVSERLVKRLGKRGYRPSSKPLSEVHVLYATRPSNWERHNIPPEIESTCYLTPYFYSLRGFDDTASDWLQVRAKMDEDLLAFVAVTHAKRPVDLFLGYLSGWQISPDTISRIGELGIVTCGFHLDDKLSFRGVNAGGRWAGPAAVAAAYDLNLTNAPSSMIKYEVEGGLAMFWPEAANPDHYRPLDLPFKYDVSFIGACYGYRPILVDYLRKNGINVEAFGPGWPNGTVSEDKMVEIYSQSRINLGFGGIGYSMKSQCLKGRDFEVPMSGALYLTSYNDELKLVYDLHSEIVTYRDKQDCLKQIKRLLMDQDGTKNIRMNARNRSLREHTWSCRIKQLLHAANLMGEQR